MFLIKIKEKIKYSDVEVSDLNSDRKIIICNIRFFACHWKLFCFFYISAYLQVISSTISYLLCGKSDQSYCHEMAFILIAHLSEVQWICHKS